MSTICVQAQFVQDTIIEYGKGQNTDFTLGIDVDSDGLPDVIRANYNPNDSPIAWYKNYGYGVYGPMQPIVNFYIWNITSFDYDEDGKLDILFTNSSKLGWIKNNGDGTFDTIVFIDETSIQSPRAIWGTDLDNDGKKDIVISNLYALTWYKNLGGGNYALLDTLFISGQQVLKRPFIGDLNGDGLTDFYIENFNLINLGGGILSSANTVTITGYTLPRARYLADFNNDTYADLLLSHTNGISWIENDGTGQFTTGHLITSKAVYATSEIECVDIDNDGNIDIPVQMSGDSTAWFENINNGNSFIEHYITSGSSNDHFKFRDIDSDGNQEFFLVDFNEQIKYFRHNGSSIYNSSTFVTDYLRSAQAYTAFDIDNDGDLDQIFGSPYKFVMYENECNAFLTQSILNIDATAHLIVKEMKGYDVNDDGKIDLFVRDFDGCYWYRNLGNGFFSSTKYTLTGPSLSAHFVDLDGDSLKDFLFVTTNSEIYWYKNLGNGNFGPVNIWNTELVQAIAPGDINGDGNTDIVFQRGVFPLPIGWIENDGLGNFTNVYWMGNTTDGDIVIADIDNDGDNDIITGNGDLVWLENIGSNTNFPENFISSGGFARYVVDLDKNGYLDVLEHSQGNSITIVYNNSFTFNKVFLNLGLSSCNWELADLDNDTDLDFIYCNDGGGFGATTKIANRINGFVSSITDNYNLCTGDSIFLEGAYQTSAGIFKDTLTSVNGCDSVVIITLSLTSTYDTTTANISICGGDSVLIFNTYRKLAGTYYDSLSTVYGCDSIITTTLVVNTSYTGSIPGSTICDGDSILIFGTYRKLTGNYNDSLTAINGCDSIISTTLSFYPPQSVFFSGLGSSYCTTDMAVTLTGTPPGGTFSGPGITGSEFDPAIAGPGTDTISYSVIDINGCTATEMHVTTVSICSGIRALGSINSLEIFPNPNTGLFNIKMSFEGSKSFELKIINSLGQVIFEETTGEIKGVYETQLNLSEYPIGAYTLQMTSATEVINRQIIIE